MTDDERRTRQPLSMTRRYRRGLILTGLLCALAVSVVCLFAGLCASFALSVPTGASVVVANVAAFLLFSLIGKLRKTY